MKRELLPAAASTPPPPSHRRAPITIEEVAQLLQEHVRRHFPCPASASSPSFEVVLYQSSPALKEALSFLQNSLALDAQLSCTADGIAALRDIDTVVFEEEPIPQGRSGREASSFCLGDMFPGLETELLQGAHKAKGWHQLEGDATFLSNLFSQGTSSNSWRHGIVCIARGGGTSTTPFLCLSKMLRQAKEFQEFASSLSLEPIRRLATSPMVPDVRKLSQDNTVRLAGQIILAWIHIMQEREPPPAPSSPQEKMRYMTKTQQDLHMLDTLSLQ